MHPEEPLVTIVRLALSKSVSSILVQILADHCLSDGMDRGRVGRRWHA
jgi:hypothetical protein